MKNCGITFKQFSAATHSHISELSLSPPLEHQACFESPERTQCQSNRQFIMIRECAKLNALFIGEGPVLQPPALTIVMNSRSQCFQPQWLRLPSSLLLALRSMNSQKRFRLQAVSTFSSLLDLCSGHRCPLLNGTEFKRTATNHKRPEKFISKIKYVPERDQDKKHTRSLSSPHAFSISLFYI